MTALIVSENYIAGGADKMTKILAENLGFDNVYILVNHDNDFKILLNPELPENVTLLKYKILTLAQIGAFVNRFKMYPLIYITFKVLSIVMRYPYIVFTIFYLLLKIKQINPDILLSNNGGYPGGEINRSAIIAGSFVRRIKMFHIVHNMPTKSPWLLRYFENLYDSLLEKKAIFIVDSKAISDRLLKMRNFKRKPYIVNPGVDCVNHVAERILVKDKVMFLNIASLDDRKNQYFLLNGILEASKAFPNKFKFTFIGSEGESNYKNKLIKYVLDNNLTQYVEFIDFSNSIDTYFKSHDIFVLTSKQEGFPLVNVMAMASKMPIISTRAGGTEDQVVSGKNGFLIEQNDLESLVSSIKLYITNKDLIYTHGNKSFYYYKSKYTFDKMIEQYREIFEINKFHKS